MTTGAPAEILTENLKAGGTKENTSQARIREGTRNAAWDASETATPIWIGRLPKDT